MTERKKCYRLQVAENLYRFIEEEALPGTGIDSDTFWRGFDAIVDEMTQKNRDLLAERASLQEEVDCWHRLNPGPVKDMNAYKRKMSGLIRKISMTKYLYRADRSLWCR